MVENTGLSDGTHFSEQPPWELHWEAEQCPPLDAIRFAPPQVSDQVLREYLRFFKPSRVQLARAIARAGDAAGPLLSRPRRGFDVGRVRRSDVRRRSGAPPLRSPQAP